jgi:diphthamide synthase subunit DPH2
MQTKIALCASISFYKHLNEIKHQLIKMGYQVISSPLAEKMEAEHNYNIQDHLKSFYGQNPNKRRGEVIKQLLHELTKVDQILVINLTKHGMAGYIGGNVLMEMGLAFHYNIPIFLLNPITDDAPFKVEIDAMQPTVINSDLTQLLHK